MAKRATHSAGAGRGGTLVAPNLKAAIGSSNDAKGRWLACPICKTTPRPMPWYLVNMMPLQDLPGSSISRTASLWGAWQPDAEHCPPPDEGPAPLGLGRARIDETRRPVDGRFCCDAQAQLPGGFGRHAPLLGVFLQIDHPANLQRRSARRGQGGLAAVLAFEQPA